jgi:hypothetical protein
MNPFGKIDVQLQLKGGSLPNATMHMEQFNTPKLLDRRRTEATSDRTSHKKV